MSELERAGPSLTRALQHARRHLDATPIASIGRRTGLARLILRRYERAILRRGRHHCVLLGTRMVFEVTTREEITHVDMNARSEAEFWGRLVASLRAGDVFCDVGAHVGMVSILVARRWRHLGVRVVAFEPERHNADRLRANVALNGVQDVITVREEAVASRPGVRDLGVFGAPGVGVHRLREEGADRSGPTQQVRAVSLDSWARASGVRPAVVKIDVEGSELDVLAGMQATLGDGLHDLFIEVHPSETCDRRRAVIEVLAARGFEPIWHAARGSEHHCHFRRVAGVGRKAASRPPVLARGCNVRPVPC